MLCRGVLESILCSIRAAMGDWRLAMRTTLLDQIKKRRLALKIKSSDMPLLAGINRQQYEKIEKGGNPNLSTIDKIAEAVDAELVLIPKDMVKEVKGFLGTPNHSSSQVSGGVKEYEDNLVADPWALIEEGKT
ncbi:helix-turn-helix transcriptional regulator [Pseudomonas sp. C11]|uniref:helix-turn-helix transcriptional regulator n=1 Tax=Pseudomonas sp. C11 TaxID=3075550 RepID=UPI002AFF7ED7|nr:helix-turn-helix transcriptional regulator [Pseudomonas sp. C11]